MSAQLLIYRRASMAGIVVASFMVSCARQTITQQVTDREAQLASTPDQQRLWREAGAKGIAPGLERLRAGERPVATRPSAQVAPQPVSVPLQGPSIPVGVTSQLRVLDTADATTEAYSGFATVRNITGDRVELDLGNQRSLTMLARAGGKPLSLTPRARVQVEYRPRGNIRTPREVVAIRTEDGNGIARAIESGSSPVTLNLPIFKLVATQLPLRRVLVRVIDNNDREARSVLDQGQTTQVGGLTVTLVGSNAVTREGAGRIETVPYSINLLVWRSGG